MSTCPGPSLQPCFAAPTLSAFREAAGADYRSFHVIAVDEAQFFPGTIVHQAQSNRDSIKRARRVFGVPVSVDA